MRLFQSTLPREERLTALCIIYPSYNYFNPRSHERSDSFSVLHDPNMIISIHAPTRGATEGCQILALEIVNFNPRSHERSDRLQSCRLSGIQISIHAPTRGATNQLVLDKLDELISIHAPTRGATNWVASMCLEKFISIHAPTRGATAKAIENDKNGVFQSTLPREERQYFVRLQSKTKHFNPRSHERSDRTVDDGGCSIFISIHAPTRGATGMLKSKEFTTIISIHAPTRGATVDEAADFPEMDISIHAPTRGATLKDKDGNYILQFQSTLPREERQVTQAD